MVLIPSNEDFSQGAASGIIDANFLEGLYECVIDETFIDLARPVTLHLRPIREQDVTTQSQMSAAQYNPFFGGVGAPRANTRDTGVRVTPRDTIYQAHIRVGPMKGIPDLMGIGDLKANEAMITLTIGAVEHLEETLSITIEGRRYEIDESRPIGFSERKYIMVKLSEINEKNSPDEAQGTV